MRTAALFLANPKNVVQALDGRSGDLLWEYRRELPKIEGGYHNDLLDRARGTIALYDDKVLLATADAHLVALDAHTGKIDLGHSGRGLSARLHIHAPGRWPPRVRSSPAFPVAPIRAPAAGVSLSPSTPGPAPKSGGPRRSRSPARRATTAGTASGRQAQWRLGLDLGQLRSGAQLGLLGHRRPDPAQRDRARHRRRRRPLHQLRPWRWMRIPARSSGTTSSCRAITGTSIMCSSRCSPISRSTVIRGKCS